MKKQSDQFVTVRLKPDLARFINGLASVFSEKPEWVIAEIAQLYMDDASCGNHHPALRIFSTVMVCDKERFAREAALIRQHDELPRDVEIQCSPVYVEGKRYWQAGLRQAAEGET